MDNNNLRVGQIVEEALREASRLSTREVIERAIASALFSIYDAPRRWGLWNTSLKCWVIEDGHDGHMGSHRPARYTTYDEAKRAGGKPHLVPKELP